MSDTRYLESSNSSSPVSCVPFPAFIKPKNGNATVQMTVNRDPEDPGPYTVQIRNNGSTIDSRTFPTPGEEELVSFTIASSQLTGCEYKLEVCVATTIDVSCCPYPVPATLKASFDVKRNGAIIASPEVNLDFVTSRPPNARYGERTYSGYYGTTLLDVPCLLEHVELQVYLFCDGDEFMYGIMTVHGDDNGEMNGPSSITTVGCSPLYLEELNLLSTGVYCHEVTSNLSIVNFHITE